MRSWFVSDLNFMVKRPLGADLERSLKGSTQTHTHTPDDPSGGRLGRRDRQPANTLIAKQGARYSQDDRDWNLARKTAVWRINLGDASSGSYLNVVVLRNRRYALCEALASCFHFITDRVIAVAAIAEGRTNSSWLWFVVVVVWRFCPAVKASDGDRVCGTCVLVLLSGIVILDVRTLSGQAAYESLSRELFTAGWPGGRFRRSPYPLNLVRRLDRLKAPLSSSRCCWEETRAKVAGNRLSRRGIGSALAVTTVNNISEEARRNDDDDELVE